MGIRMSTKIPYVIVLLVILLTVANNNKMF